MKQLLIICLSLCFLHSFAQDKNKFYALDAKLQETVLDSSKYILWVHQIEGSNWQFDYYRTWGPLVKTQTFADREGVILNGRSSIYNSFGNLDSTGLFEHGKKNGAFFKFKTVSKDNVVPIRRYEYLQDSLVAFLDLVTEKNKDSNTIQPPTYPDGEQKLNQYIAQHMRYPERAMPKQIQGKTIIAFIIDQYGKGEDFFMEKSVEYSIDQEVIRVIKSINAWEPGAAKETGPSRYYYQPVNVKLE